MALKPDQLKAGLQKGIAGEKEKASSRFDRADEEMEGRKGGLASPKASPAPKPSAAPAPAPTFTGESSGRKLREIRVIPLDSIDDNPYNARRIYLQEHVREMAAHMATHGQKIPVLAMVSPDAPGRYILIDGQYRKRAAQIAGIRTLDVLIEPIKTHAELYSLSYALNEERNPQTTLDNALAWRHLLNTKVAAKEEDIGKLTREEVSPATISKTLAILDLPQSVLDRIAEAPTTFGVSIAYEVTLINKVAGEQHALDAVKRVLTDGWGRRDLEEFRKRFENPKPRKKKDVSRQYKIRNEHGHQLGFIKEWDSGKVVFEIRLTDPKEREAVVEEFKTRFHIE